MNMGQRGPAPLPSNVHLLRGNPSKKPFTELLDGVRPECAEPDMPKCVKVRPAARKAWERIVPELLKLGLLARIDEVALTSYALSVADLHDAEAAIRAANKAEPDRPHAGLITSTPSGYEQMSVLVQLKGRALDQLKHWLREFGMSPSARTRVVASNPQLPLDLAADEGAADPDPMRAFLNGAQ